MTRGAEPYRGTRPTNQAAYDEIRGVLASLPSEDDRQLVLMAVLVDRCRRCLGYSSTGRCCGPRGG